MHMIPLCTGDLDYDSAGGWEAVGANGRLGGDFIGAAVSFPFRPHRNYKAHALKPPPEVFRPFELSLIHI